MQYAKSFNGLKPSLFARKPSVGGLRMMIDYDFGQIHHHVHDLQQWMTTVYQGIAAEGETATATATAAVEATQTICPDFGQPGWNPFCFSNGNPIFNAFDSFQFFIQNSVVSLHDILSGWGLKEAYGPSIILFTVFIRLLLFPVTFNQLSSTQKTQALNPMIKEIKEKFPDNKEIQNQLVAMLYQESKVNPLAGCLPALLQIPVFIALYRSFQNLAADQILKESFLWLPDLEGPVYGTRGSDWLFTGWHFNAWNDFGPSLGWYETLAFFSIPVILYFAQSVSLKILSPPSDDPAVAKSQAILKYLPLMLAYFSLSVPAGLGVYWITNNLLSTVSTWGIKEYFKRNPVKMDSVDIDALIASQFSQSNPALYTLWGYKSEDDMIAEAKLNYHPNREPVIPSEFV
eukprot:gene4011-4388_t